MCRCALPAREEEPSWIGWPDDYPLRLARQLSELVPATRLPGVHLL
jgi:hypothetical protein